MTTHLDKGHLSAFNSYNELWEYVGGKPILSKLGLIVKTRNGVESARTILDTKESDVKRITAKTQRVILPRIFDAVLRMLSLLSRCAVEEKQVVQPKNVVSVKAFVLDFSEAFWQMPIHPLERRFFCASTKI